MSSLFLKKSIIITGGASGLGLGIAKRALSEGAFAVYICDINEQKLNEQAAALNAEHPGKTRTAVLNVTDQQAFRALAARVNKECGQIDMIFNNAGIAATFPTDKCCDEHDDKISAVIDINIKGVLYGIRAVLPYMLKQNSGMIVSTASMGGILPAPYQMLYASTKISVVWMTMSLHYEFLHTGVRFFAFCPGNVATGIFPEGFALPEDTISTEQAIDHITDGLDKGKTVFCFPEKWQSFESALPINIPILDKELKETADERRHNYETKGTYC